MSTAVKIIMIEDDHGHAKLIEKNIRRANISNDIAHFDDGGSALDYLFSAETLANGPLLILLDLNLPDMSGTDILEKVKGDDRLKRAPVVVLTTSAEPFDVEASYALGVNSYIQKPVDFEQFVWAVKQVGLYWLVLNHPRTA